MKIERTCDDESITAFLADQMSTDEVRSFETHLESCPRCRERLSAAAADDSWWTETQEFLLKNPMRKTCTKPFLS